MSNKMLCTCLIMCLFTAKALGQPTTSAYSQVRLQMPAETFKPVVGMTETEIREEMERPLEAKTVKSSTDDDAAIMQKVNSQAPRSIPEIDGDTLESIIEWVNGNWAEESPLQNIINEN